MVIFALLAGNALLGILGVLLAAPVAATVNIVLTYLITEGALSTAAMTVGDDIPPPLATFGASTPAETGSPTATPVSAAQPSPAATPAATAHATERRQA